MTNDEFKIAIGRRVAELRKAKDWTLDELAKRSALKRSAISNYEQGARLPGPEEITLLAKAFDVSRAYLFCLDDKSDDSTQTQSETGDDIENKSESGPPKVEPDEIIRLMIWYGQSTEAGRGRILKFAENAEKIAGSGLLSAARD